MSFQFVILILAFFAASWFKETGSEQNRRRQRKNYIFFMMSIFVLQSGLRREDVGPDTGQYKMFFYESISRTWSDYFSSFRDFIRFDEGKDPGYYLLNKLFGEVFPSYQLFLIFIAILFFTALGKLLYKYLNSNEEILVALSLYQCLFYSFMSITGHRQTVATAFLLFAVPHILNKKWIKAGLLFALAITQHKSAILFGVFFALPFVCTMYKKLIIASAAVFPVMLRFGGSVALFFMEDTRMEQYANYLEEYEGAGAYFFAAFILLLAACLFWKGKSLADQNDSNKVFISAIAGAVVLTPLTMINPSNMRIVQYYSIFSLLILPQFLTTIKSSFRSFNIHSIIFWFFAFYTFLRPISYYFFWE